MSSSLAGQNLYSEIENSPDHSIFLELVEFTGLDSLLVDDGFHSVFVPNNAAIESRYDLDELDSLKVNDRDFLESLILNHFVLDTVIAEPITDFYLPLSGSHFLLFVDGAGSVGLRSLGAPIGQAHPYLSETFGSIDLFKDLENGRLFWMENNILHPNCKTTGETNFNFLGALSNVVTQSEWFFDSIYTTTRPLTFLCPNSNAIYDYIDQNGGLGNTTFVDSFIQRHIIDEYISLQAIDNSSVVKNLLGEEITISKQGNRYFLNRSKVGDSEIVNYYDFKKSAAIGIDSFLVQPIVSKTENLIPIEFRVFPNPAFDKITINNSGNLDRSFLRIFSIDGNLISEGEYYGSTFEVDIGALRPGLYFLDYRNGFNFKTTKLMVL